jgi:peptide-methionine (S)-S-oxide reductase
MSNQRATMQEKAYFGGGCFWCTEAIFQELKGVTSVTSGYAGGISKRPSYFTVSEGITGHAEVIEIAFDPSIITYEQLLDVFFHTHNPTTLNQQGADVGTQYRSIILTTSDDQAKTAKAFIQQLKSVGEFSDPIVTEIKPFEAFYPAENYHKNYYKKNTDVPYCQVVISPKMAKFHQRFKALLKNSNSP